LILFAKRAFRCSAPATWNSAKNSYWQWLTRNI